MWVGGPPKSVKAAFRENKTTAKCLENKRLKDSLLYYIFIYSYMSSYTSIRFKKRHMLRDVRTIYTQTSTRADKYLYNIHTGLYGLPILREGV